MPDTLARYRQPVTMFVMNDEGYGQERRTLSAMGFAREASFSMPKLAGPAAAFGIHGEDMPRSRRFRQC